MYETYFSKKDIPAPRAQEVAIRARRQEKEMALLNAEYKSAYARTRGRSTNLFIGMVYGLLSIIGLN